MGLFDMMRVEVEIPGCGDCSHMEFQTKQFNNNMEHYVITKTGELYRETWKYEWVDDKISKAWGIGSLQKIEGSYLREYLTNYHGDVIFYNGTVNGKWRNYHARFTEGKLKTIWYEDTQY